MATNAGKLRRFQWLADAWMAGALDAKGVPFIFATGYGIAGISEAFSNVPAIAKPYEPRTIERLLASTLNRPTSGSS